MVEEILVPEEVEAAIKTSPWNEAEPKKSMDPVISAAPAVSFAVFAACSGIKRDQLAGFQRFAKARKFGPRTILEWRRALQDFENTPTKG